MVDITGIIPLSLGGIIGLLINVVIITIVLALADKFLAHEMSFKKSFIMAIIAYLAVPIILAASGISFEFSGYIIPLIIWIVLGQFLLKGGHKKKLIAAAVAFIVWIILMFAGVPGILATMIPF
ncbi:hypothetical protein HYZ41_01050 [archaeon]|nr:hypothetical protein [archaeon]